MIRIIRHVLGMIIIIIKTIIIYIYICIIVHTDPEVCPSPE